MVAGHASKAYTMIGNCLNQDYEAKLS